MQRRGLNKEQLSALYSLPREVTEQTKIGVPHTGIKCGYHDTKICSFHWVHTSRRDRTVMLQVLRSVRFTSEHDRHGLLLSKGLFTVTQKSEQVASVVCIEKEVKAMLL